MGEPVVSPGRSSQLWDQQAKGVGQAATNQSVSTVGHHSPSVAHTHDSLNSVPHICHSGECFLQICDCVYCVIYGCL